MEIKNIGGFQYNACFRGKTWNEKERARLHADIKSMTHALNIRMQIVAARSPKEVDL